jgi:hypothetical protein
MTRRQTSRTRGPAHRLLPSYSPGLLRDPSASENPAKIGQKSVYFYECESVKASTPKTYNFDPSKQTDFPAPDLRRLSLFASLPLCVFALKRRLKLTKTDRFRTKLPGLYCTATVAKASSLHAVAIRFGERTIEEEPVQNEYILSTKGVGGVPFSKTDGF